MKRFVLLVALAFTVCACADNPQVVLLKGGQSLTQLLTTAQKAENTFCAVDAAKPTHCDATIPGLSSTQLDALHVKIAGAFVKAYTDKIAYDTAASRWQPGQGSPTSLANLKSDFDDIVTALKSVTDASVQAALSAAQAVVDEVANIIAAVTGKEAL